MIWWSPYDGCCTLESWHSTFVLFCSARNLRITCAIANQMHKFATVRWPCVVESEWQQTSISIIPYRPPFPGHNPCNTQLARLAQRDTLWFDAVQRSPRPLERSAGVGRPAQLEPTSCRPGEPGVHGTQCTPSGGCTRQGHSDAQRAIELWAFLDFEDQGWRMLKGCTWKILKVDETTVALQLTSPSFMWVLYLVFAQTDMHSNYLNCISLCNTFTYFYFPCWKVIQSTLAARQYGLRAFDALNVYI